MAKKAETLCHIIGYLMFNFSFILVKEKTDKIKKIINVMDYLDNRISYLLLQIMKYKNELLMELNNKVSFIQFITIKKTSCQDKITS